MKWGFVSCVAQCQHCVTAVVGGQLYILSNCIYCRTRKRERKNRTLCPKYCYWYKGCRCLLGKDPNPSRGSACWYTDLRRLLNQDPNVGSVCLHSNVNSIDADWWLPGMHAWWQGYERHFMLLVNCATQYYVPISAPCKWLFRCTGIIFSINRIALDTHNLENWLLIKLNKSLHKFVID